MMPIWTLRIWRLLRRNVFRVLLLQGHAGFVHASKLAPLALDAMGIHENVILHGLRMAQPDRDDE
jgi:hypothetical protein